MTCTVERVGRLCVIVLSTIAAGCSTTRPNAENAYAKDRVPTGSNIPKKGQAVVVDRDAAQDALNRGAGH